MKSRKQRGRRSFSLGIAIAATATGVLAGAPPAGAATIVVGPTDDAQNGSFDDTGCTLRDAVQAANTNAPLPNGDCPTADTAGADTIILQSGSTYNLTFQFAQENNNIYGDLDVESVVTIRSSGPELATINGPALLGGDKDRVLHVEPTSGGVTLNRIQIQNGHYVHPNTGTTGGGAGIFNEGSSLTVIDSEIVNNKLFTTAGTTTQGAGIFTNGAGSLTMTGSTVAGNVATSASSTDTVGGGISVFGVGSSIELTNSTISGNTATGTVWPGFVGGVFAGDGFASTPETTLTSVTITGNVASGPGAITGGIQAPTGTMSGVLMAGNSDPGGTSPDCRGGPEFSGGGNFVGDAGSSPGNCSASDLDGPGDLIGPDDAPIPPGLGALSDFGGPTRTHEVLPGSAPHNRGGSCPATDQRGRFRFNVLPCDSGAFELGASTTPPPTPPPATVTAGPTGERAAALKRCKKKKTKAKRKKCRKRAMQLPV